MTVPNAIYAVISGSRAGMLILASGFVYAAIGNLLAQRATEFVTHVKIPKIGRRATMIRLYLVIFLDLESF